MTLCSELLILLINVIFHRRKFLKTYVYISFFIVYSKLKGYQVTSKVCIKHGLDILFLGYIAVREDNLVTIYPDWHPTY